VSEEKLNNILGLVEGYIKEKRSHETWKPGDWIKYSGPNYGAEEYVAAIRSLLSEWLVFGKKSSKFESEFPKYLGKKYGVLTNSGSSANLLMVSSLKSSKRKGKYRLRDGDKIITPVVCFPTTINPIIQNNLVPVFVDVDIPSLNLDLDKVEEILESDSNGDIKGIMFAHVFGNPPDMNRLMRIVNKYDLIFLEDACDALGSFYDGKKLGSFGHMSTCSFYPAHHMTLGEGGFVATDRAPVQASLASFRDWGRACYCNTYKPGDVTCATACGNRFREWLPGRPELIYDHRYVFDEIGYNLKPLDLQAAMGLEQLKKLPEMEEARRRNFDKLYQIFEKYEKYFHLPVATKNSDPCWFGFLLIAKSDNPFSKQDFIDYMEKNKIQTRSYFAGNALYHPAYKHLSDSYDDLRDAFPNADLATKGSFFLGTYIGLTEEKLEYIQQVVDRFFKGVPQ
jgi:CDP-6-deoxy-D-xylo-4-hexulose-3-dehydrase